jgi:hypothetical protein
MTDTAPALHAAVTLSTDGGATLRALVQLVEDEAVSLGLPDGSMPRPGVGVTLHWPAGPRGRWSQPGTVVAAVGPAGTCPATVVVHRTGTPTLEQQRQFVRGGGGEPVTVGGVEGRLRDIGEQGLRARVPGHGVRRGDAVRARVELDDDVLTFAGTVHKIDGEDLVVVFVSDEAQAQIIRRYVLRQQMLARARTAGD